MQREVLEADFFDRSALIVAKELLGKYLVRRLDGLEIAEPITETEAYVGPHDLACHAAKGCTPRTAVMFGPAGFWYVYFIYGIHWMLNVVVERQGFPAAVLFRTVGAWNGPAKLTKALTIDKCLNGQAAAPLSGLWIENRGLVVRPKQIQRSPRIGVSYAGAWADKPYRFQLAEDKKLSADAADLRRLTKRK